jgi:O-antigen/teichoic acid export membrane protein
MTSRESSADLAVDTARSDSAAAAVHSATRSFLGRGSTYTVIWALQALVILLVTPILTRLLGSNQFGQASLALTLLQVLIALATLGLQGGIQRLFVEERGPERARGVLGLSVLLSTVVGAILLMTLGWWVPLFGLEHNHGLAATTTVCGVLGSMATSALALLRSHDDLRWFALVSLSQSVAGQAIGIFFLIDFQRSSAAYLLGVTSGQLLATALALGRARPRPSGVLDRRTNQAMLAYSLPLVPHTVAAFVLNAGDRLVVEHYLGATAVARYQVAYNIGCFGILLLGVLNQALVPMLFGIREDATRWQISAQLRDQTIRILLPFTAAVCMGAPVALRVLAPPAYRPSGLTSVAAIVALSAFPYAWYIACIRVLMWHKRTGLLGLASMAAAGVNVLLNIVFVPAIGIFGSALATLLCYAILGVLASLTSNRLSRMPRPGPSVLLSVASAGGFAVAGTYLPSSPVWLAVRAAATVVCIGWLVRDARAFRRGPRKRGSHGVSHSHHHHRPRRQDRDSARDLPTRMAAPSVGTDGSMLSEPS